MCVCVCAHVCMCACLLACMCVQLVQVGGAHEPAIASGGRRSEGGTSTSGIDQHTHIHT